MLTESPSCLLINQPPLDNHNKVKLTLITSPFSIISKSYILILPEDSEFLGLLKFSLSFLLQQDNWKYVNLMWAVSHLPWAH